MRIRSFSLTLAGSMIALTPSIAQQPATIDFVAPNLTGRAILTPGADWQPQSILLLDDDVRPVVTFKNKVSGIQLSIILFPNNTGRPTSESCRDAAIAPILENLADSAIVTNQVKGTLTAQNGLKLATQSYRIEKVRNTAIDQQNLFGFYGDKSTCAEIHVSKALYKDSDAAALDDALKQFRFEPGYHPTSHDYAVLGSIFFAAVQHYKAAAVYYQLALDTLGHSPSDLAEQRFLTDQLSMSYGMYGDAARSRKINEDAIARDPDYPIYYYNLACADAADNNLTAAQEHLQQAFDRREHVLKGEKFPDPATDDSFTRFRDDPEFWSFVTHISAELKEPKK